MVVGAAKQKLNLSKSIQNTEQSSPLREKQGGIRSIHASPGIFEGQALIYGAP